MRAPALVVLAAVIVGPTVAACGRGGPAAPATTAPAPPPRDPTPITGTLDDAELEAMLAELVTLLDAAVKTVDAAGHDCGAVARGLDRLVGDHGTFYERARRADDPSVEDRAQRWLVNHEDAVEPLLTRLGAALAPCTDDPAVQRAVERLGGA